MTVVSDAIALTDKPISLAFFLPLDIAESLALPNGEVANSLRLVVADFGQPGAIADVNKFINALQDYCEEIPAIEARITGTGKFNASDATNNRDVVYASVDSPVLNYFRDGLLDVCMRYGMYDPSPFIPHIVLAYGNSSASVPTQDFIFSQLTLLIGDDRYVFDLANPSPVIASEVIDSFHFDAGEVLNVEQHPDGYLVVRGIATRAGVFHYLNQDGSLRKELRHPKDILNPDSLRTLGPVPVTLEHPPEKVTPANVHKYQVGSVSNRIVERDGGDFPLVEVVLNIHRQDAIDAVLSKQKIGLSAGYATPVIKQSGEYKGESYDHRQVNPIYNHLAICQNPRAGPVASLKLDSSDVVYMSQLTMQKLKLDDGTEFDVPEAVALAFENLQQNNKRNDSAELEKRTREFQQRTDAILEEKKQLEANLVVKDSTIAQLQSRIDRTELDLRDERSKRASVIDEEVASRVDAFTKARPYLPQNMRDTLDPKMSATDIKRIAVETQNPQLKLDSADPKEIEGAFKMLLASSPRQDSTEPLRNRINQLKQETPVADIDTARERQAKKASEAWQVTN